MNIGDRFVVDWKKLKSLHQNMNICKDINKEFSITSFSKSMLSVYFEDNRTNKRGCKCFICEIGSIKKCIGIYSIMITQTKQQYERDKKLKRILNGE